MNVDPFCGFLMLFGAKCWQPPAVEQHHQVAAIHHQVHRRVAHRKGNVHVAIPLPRHKIRGGIHTANAPVGPLGPVATAPKRTDNSIPNLDLTWHIPCLGEPCHAIADQFAYRA